MRPAAITFLLISWPALSGIAQSPDSYVFSKPSFNNHYIFLQSLQAETLPAGIRLHSCEWLILDAKSLIPIWRSSYPFKENNELPIRHGTIIFDDGEHLALFRTRFPYSPELIKQGRTNILPETELIRFYNRSEEVVSYSAKDLNLDLSKIEGNSVPHLFVIRPVPDYTARWSWLGDGEFWRELENHSKDDLKFSDFDGKTLKMLFEDGTRVHFSPEGKILKTDKVQIKPLLLE